MEKPITRQLNQLCTQFKQKNLFDAIALIETAQSQLEKISEFETKHCDELIDESDGPIHFESEAILKHLGEALKELKIATYW